MNETVTPETDATAEPSAEETSQQDGGLDALLDEWDGSQEETPQAPAKSQEDLEARVIAAVTAKQDYEKLVQDFSSSVSDVAFDVDSDLVDVWLNTKAKKDARINKAYLERHANPAKWKGVFSELTKEFRGQFKVKEEETVDADREAAVAFVRGSSTKEVPDKPMTDTDMAKMSDKEFMEYQRKEFGV